MFISTRMQTNLGCRWSLMMPHSKKGRNRKPGHTPVPITVELAARLRAAVAGRAAHDPIFTEINYLSTRLREVAKRNDVVPYSFRHSSIVTMLKANVPIRIVASHHDTSVAIIEKHYSAYINDSSDAMIRATLAEFEIATAA